MKQNFQDYALPTTSVKISWSLLNNDYERQMCSSVINWENVNKAGFHRWEA